MDMQSKIRKNNESIGLELGRSGKTDEMVKDMIEKDRENM